MPRIALKIQYLGTHFWGWQRQPRHRSVQAVLEEAIELRALHSVRTEAAGRTDTGVHASGQVVHFETSSPIQPQRWPRVINNCIQGNDVAVLTAAEVPQDWHARFSALWRRYRYLILNQEDADVFWQSFSWHYPQPLDAVAMARALESIIGNHNLEAFRRAGSKRPHSWVTVQEVVCRRQGNVIAIDVQASGFLYRMMRLLVGALSFVGRGTLSPEEFGCVWQTNDWSRVPSRYSAPPQGLCLTGIGYASDPFLVTSQRHPSPFEDQSLSVPWSSQPLSPCDVVVSLMKPLP
ncbi:MAG: tRNA pseudouridine(38-40) synthase TruA [Synechococcaceae cyanobacterium SM2_3_1]|nr:tRNA pseudouridine(38-40) synthase TruA [Synechococcaceae cyanobacterium SM2_3_1]